MVNIVLAASNISTNATREELKTTYGPIVGFIRRQHRIILGNDLTIPDSIEAALKRFQHIVLTLPKAYKMPDKLGEYYRLAKKTLISA